MKCKTNSSFKIVSFTVASIYYNQFSVSTLSVTLEDKCPSWIKYLAITNNFTV